MNFEAMMAKIKATNKKPSILMGAGCSITGGIPTANEIINEIKSNTIYSECLNGVNTDDYFVVMNCFDSIVRRAIFHNYISKSKINVSSFIASQLLIEGKIKNILTTNFDDLIPRSSSLFSNPIPIYDVTLTNKSFDNSIYFPSIIYLHGQMHGYWQLNTGSELNKHKDTIRYFIKETINDTPLIVIGYSGNDHVLDLLAEYEKFSAGLYWITYDGEKLSKRVSELLGDKIGFYPIEGSFNSDYFFYRFGNIYNIINKYNSSFFRKSLEHLSQINSVISYNEHEIDILDSVKRTFAKALDLIDDTAINISKTKSDLNQTTFNYQDLIDTYINIHSLVVNSINLNFSIKDKESVEQLNNYYDNAVVFFRNNARKLNSEKLFELTIDLCNKILVFEHSDKYYFNLILAVSFSEWGKIERNKEKLNSAFNFYNKSLEFAGTELRKQVILGCIATSKHDIANILIEENSDKIEIDKLLNEAYTIFSKAIKISNENGKLLNNISSLLIDTSVFRKDLFLINRAIEKAKEAEQIKSGAGSYNLAACHALLGEFDEAFKWLEKALNNRQHKREQIDNEKNFLELKTDKRYKALIEKYYS
ncbi:MAG: SIR2 family protein [Bacteroidia bacterium]